MLGILNWSHTICKQDVFQTCIIYICDRAHVGPAAPPCTRLSALCLSGIRQLFVVCGPEMCPVQKDKCVRVLQNHHIAGIQWKTAKLLGGCACGACGRTAGDAPTYHFVYQPINCALYCGLMPFRHSPTVPTYNFRLRTFGLGRQSTFSPTGNIY